MDAGTLDPHIGSSGGDDWFWRQMFDHLVAYDQNLVPRPELSLAETWEFPDQTTMTCRLRKGVKFHDGTLLNAQAVKYSLDRMKDPKTKAPLRANLDPLERVDVIDDSTVKLILNRPSASILAVLGGRSGTVVSPAAVEKYGDSFGVHPVGTGPFQFVEWAKGSYVTMKRNPEYWRKDEYGNQIPFVDELKMNVILDSTVIAANLQTGDMDVGMITATQLDNVRKSKNLAVRDKDGASVAVHIRFDIAKPPLDDVNLRLAIAYGINPEPLNQAIWFGDCTVAKAGIWPPGNWVYNESVPRPFYDPKKAKEYLAKAGKPNGFSFDLAVQNRPEQMQAGEMIQAQLSDIGIKANVTNMENNAMAVAFNEQNSIPAVLGTWPLGADPDPTARVIFRSDGYYCAGHVKNDELDGLIDKGATTYDIEECKKIYNQINAIVLNQVYYLPLLYGRYHAGHSTRVQNMEHFFGGDAVGRYHELWIKQ